MTSRVRLTDERGEDFRFVEIHSEAGEVKASRDLSDLTGVVVPRRSCLALG